LAIEFGAKTFRWPNEAGASHPLYQAWADRIENLMNVRDNPERLAACVADANTYSGH
jgi:hypothetical protein